MSEEEYREKVKQEWAHLARVGLTVFITVACCILFFFIILRFNGFANIWGMIFKAGQPIIIGLVLAYLLNPIMKFIEGPSKKFYTKHMKNEAIVAKVSRITAVAGTTIFLIVVISLLIAAVVPATVSSASSLITTLPENAQKAIDLIQKGIFKNSMFAEMSSNMVMTITNNIENFAQNTLLPQAQRYLAQITSGVVSVVRGMVNFIIGIFVMDYVMMIQETLKGQSKKLIYAIFKPVRGNIIIETVRKTSDIFGGFISGKIIDSLIVAVICYIGCLILRIPDPVLVAVIVGVTNVIPVFGPFIGAIPCLLLVGIQSPWHALYLLIFILVLQQVDGNVIGPKVLGSSTGLSTFWVMFAILIGGGLFGFMGMLLGVPVFGVIYYIVSRIVNYALKKKELPVATKEYITLDKIDENSNKMVYEEH